MANPIDKYFGIDCLKAEVDKAHKEAKQEAECFLAELRDSVGTMALTSPMFGPEAGEFKYGQTRAKKITEYNLASAEDFEDWVNDNAYGVFLYLKAHAAEFGEWWVNENGEVPDGISRVCYEQPPTTTTPKIYRQDREVVKAKLAANGGFFEEANRLLLDDGE